MKQRWLPVGLVALAILAVNVVARLVSWKANITNATQQADLGFIGVVVVALLLVGVSARWSWRYPFGRVIGDLGLAVIIGGLLTIVVGPFAGGSRPFADGLAFVVGQFLLFFVVGVIGIVLGFWAVVAFGKDWKSRGLLRAEQHFGRRTRPARK
jgi:hypothetical protein